MHRGDVAQTANILACSHQSEHMSARRLKAQRAWLGHLWYRAYPNFNPNWRGGKYCRPYEEQSLHTNGEADGEMNRYEIGR